MAKGTYSVTRRRDAQIDASFRSCICTMFVFMVLFLIIMLASWPWKNGNNRISGENHEDSIDKEALTETERVSKQKKSDRFEKLMLETSTQTNAENPDILKTTTSQTQTAGTKLDKIAQTHTTAEEVELYKSAQTSTEESIFKAAAQPNTAESTAAQTRTEHSILATTARTQTVIEQNIAKMTAQIPTEKPTLATTVQSATEKSILATTAQTTTEETKLDTAEQTVSEDLPTATAPYKITSKIIQLLTKMIYTTPTPTVTTSTTPSTIVNSSKLTSSSEESTLVMLQTTVSSIIAQQNYTKYEERQSSTPQSNDYVGMQLPTTTEETNTTTYQETMKELTSTMRVNERESYILSATRKVDEDHSDEIGFSSTHLPNIVVFKETSRATPISLERSSPNDSSTSYNITPVSNSEVESTTDSVILLPALPCVSSVDQDQGERHCDSVPCKMAASRMLSLMNHGEDPCEYFYEYSCGGMRISDGISEIDPKKDVWKRINERMDNIDSNSSLAFTSFKIFYDSCTAFEYTISKDDRLKQVKKLLSSFIVAGEDAPLTIPSIPLTETFAYLLKNHVALLFDVLTEVDVTTGKLGFMLTAPIHKEILSEADGGDQYESVCFQEQNKIIKQDLTSADKKPIDLNKLYTSYNHCKGNYASYLQNIDRSLRELDFFSNLPAFNVTQSITRIRTAIEWDFLDTLQTLPSPGEMRNIIATKQYVLKTVQQLQTDFPVIDWSTLFEILVGRKIPISTNVQVYFVDYFTNLFDKFKTSTSYKLVQQSLLAMYAHELYTQLVLPRSTCDRRQYCLQVAAGYMEDVSSALYIESFKPQELYQMEKYAKEMFQHLTITLSSKAKLADWLDEESRTQLVQKIHRLKIVADGGKMSFLNNSLLDDHFLGFPLCDNFIINVAVLSKRYRRLVYASYLADPFDHLWSQFILPYHTDAIAVYTLETVVVPFGMLVDVQALNDLPKYLSLSRHGYAIAQQIAHHFDSTGVHFNNANVSEPISLLLSSQTVESFQNYVSIVKNHFNTNSSVIQNVGGINIALKVNAELSLNQRLSDDTALQLSIDTYKHYEIPGISRDLLIPWLGLTKDQLYFLAVAQNHCTKSSILDHRISVFESEALPPMLTVDTLLRNSNAFSDAFKCRRGSRMNPEYEVSHFPNITRVEDSYFETPVNN